MNHFETYIGTRCYARGLTEQEAIDKGIEVVKKQKVKGIFVPPAVVWDAQSMLCVVFITDDANGVTVHRRNAVATA